MYVINMFSALHVGGLTWDICTRRGRGRVRGGCKVGWSGLPTRRQARTVICRVNPLADN